MKAFSQFVDMSKRNKLFVIVVILLCFAAIEFTTHFFSEIPAKFAGGSAGQVVAVVQEVKTDVRQKPVEEQSWYRAEPQNDIIRGDAVYSGGQSHAQVKMQSGGILEMGEETLVIFDDVDGVTVPDVTRGSVKIKITGSMKIAISGEVTEFTGAQSELELNADGTRGSVRALKGKVGVLRKGASIRNLVTGQEMELPPSTEKHDAPKVQIPKANELISEIRIADKRNPGAAAPKPVATPIAEVAVPIAPAPVIEPVPVVKLAEVAPPLPPPVAAVEALTPQDPSLQIIRVMKLQEVYQRRGQRALVPKTGMKFLKVPVALAWNGAKPEEKVFLQISKEKTFSKPWAEREANGKNTVVQEWKPGRNYWRVSRDRKTWTDASQVNVKPTVAVQQNPSIALFKNTVVVHGKGKGPEAQAKLRFQDSALPKARGWVLQGSNTPSFAPEKTRTVYVSEPRVDIPLSKPGKYFFRVRSVASAGEISSFSAPAEVTAVKAAAPPAPIRVAKKVQAKEREIAAIDDEKDAMKDSLKDEIEEKEIPRQTARMRTTPKKPDDDRYRPWSVTVEGGETAIVSSEQIAAEGDPASTHVLGLRGTYADGRNTITGAYHSKFGGANAQGSAQSNSRMEGRYTRWWQTGWTWLRLGLVGGLEKYSNTASTQFSKGYTAAKTGVNVDIGLADRWKTGGDILVGGWTDANMVYEIGGFVSYDFTRELAFGVGYRLSLFEAGTAASAPIDLPYREAMGEAYSSLKFSF